MKILKYNLPTKVNTGTVENPQEMVIFSRVAMPWNEANEEIARSEAHNGKYTIEDDGEEETHEPTDAERITELEEALAMLLNGVTE